jgi:hypothetical protein
MFYDLHYIKHERLPNRPLRKIAEQVTQGMTDDLAKVMAMTSYIKKEYTWNGVKDFWARDLAGIIEKKKGTSGDLNILLSKMLQEMGYKPSLVLLSTHSNGQIIKQLPTMFQFNYVVVKLTIGEQDYILDCTDRLLPFGMLPLDCMSVDALEIVEKAHRWIRIDPLLLDKVSVNARLIIDEDLSLKGRVAVSSLGYVAREKRKRFIEQGEKKYLATQEAVATWEVDSAKIANGDKVDQPFLETYFASIPNQIQETPERLYLDPFILLVNRENIWKEQTRNYPVDLLMPEEKLLVVTLTVPQGYKIENVPANKTVALPDNSIVCSFKTLQSNNVLVISYQLVMARSQFQKNEYGALRDFFNQVLARQGEPVILMKKSL